MQSPTKLVSNGRSRMRDTPEYRAAVARIRASADADFAPLIREAGPVRSIVLIVQRQRRISLEIRNLAPLDATY